MKIEINTITSKRIKAEDIPPGRIAKVSETLFLASGSYAKHDELLRIWPTANDFQHISKTAVEGWDVELLPEGTEIKFTF